MWVKVKMSNLAKVVLAIDTSCDETAAAVTCGLEVWSNVIASQVELHRPYGGVFPTVAKQAHRENIEAVVALALKRAGVTIAEIDEIVVTVGPGLAPALEVGIEKAKQLAADFGKPLRTANHLAGHLWSVWALRQEQGKRVVLKQRRARAWRRSRTQLERLQLPALGLIVSGGNTFFVLVERRQEKDASATMQTSAPAINKSSTSVDLSVNLDRQPRLTIADAHHPQFQYTIIGQTLDDAAGEALDKIGRMVNLGYPAGPVVEQLAKTGDVDFFDWPLPMTERPDFNLSFAGIKTHARRLTEAKWSHKPPTAAEITHFAAGLQNAIFRHIIYKLNKYLEKEAADNNLSQIRQLWLGGGVACNQTLRSHLRRLAHHHRLQLLTPFSGNLCTDNAGMVGIKKLIRIYH